MTKKYLVPVVMTRRATTRKAKTARGWCKKFRFHRFGVLAESAADAQETIAAFVVSEPFCEKFKLNRKSARVSLTVLFPTGIDVTPVERENVYLHMGIVRSGGEGPNANYRTLVAATSPEMADWRAREGHFSKSVEGCKRPVSALLDAESYVLPAGGDLVYLGEANLTEAESFFRKTYMVLADEADRESGAPAIDMSAYEEDIETLYAELTEESKLCLPVKPSPEEIARGWVLQQSGDASARRMSDGSEEGERILAAFLSRMTPHLFQTYSHDVIGAGVSAIDDDMIERVRESNLLVSGRI